MTTMTTTIKTMRCLFLAAALAAALFSAGGARAEYNEICVDLEGGVLMKLRVVSAAYTSRWTRQYPSPGVKCLDIRKVPYGQYFHVEVDPTLWGRRNFSCERQRRTHKPPQNTGWKAKATLWSQGCSKFKRGVRRHR